MSYKQHLKKKKSNVGTNNHDGGIRCKGRWSFTTSCKPFSSLYDSLPLSFCIYFSWSLYTCHSLLTRSSGKSKRQTCEETKKKPCGYWQVLEDGREVSARIVQVRIAVDPLGVARRCRCRCRWWLWHLFTLLLTSFVRLILLLLRLAAVLLALENLVHYRSVGAVLLRLDAARRTCRRSWKNSFRVFWTFILPCRSLFRTGCSSWRSRWRRGCCTGKPFVTMGFVGCHSLVGIPSDWMRKIRRRANC